jgi:hypothetical protein
MQHKWILTTVLALTLIPVLLVMSPTMYRFYTDPDVIPLSSISVTQIVHTAVSIPALATAVMFASGKMPKNVKKGMCWAASFWIASMVLGVLLFLQMMELIPTF